ncbi:FAD binding domain-containing protein, partial [Acidobacteriota bacterium]
MKQSIRFIMNDRKVETFLPVGAVVLDFIRQHQHLFGTKEGCKEGECGACTILLGQLTDNNLQYKAVASCLLPLGELQEKHIVTVEGLNSGSLLLTPVQQALVEEGASQCGFCTPGIVMSLTGFFLTGKTLDYREAIDALDGNICRCTGYVPIQRAAKKLCDTYAPQLGCNNSKNRVQQLVRWSILPDYFLQIPGQLNELNSQKLAHSPPSELPSQKVSKRKTIVVAGGTDLYVQQPEELLEKKLELVSRRSDLTGIQKKGDWLFIGAGTTAEEMKHSPLINEIFPHMKNYLNLVSSTIMRNRATLAGNIVNASPIGDLTIILLALEADLCLVKGKTRRELQLKDFFKGYKKLDMKKDEIIETIEVPIPYPGLDSRFHFEKVSRRKYLDIASCNTAISLKMDNIIINDVHISAGGVAPIPLYLEETCAWLRGKEVTAANISKAVKVAQQEISPISDVRGSAQYKTLLLRNLIFAHFITLFP